MRLHTQSFDGIKVDLDDPKTYEHLPNDVSKLDDLMMMEIGKAICYMDYFPSRRGLFPKEKQKEEYHKLSEWYPDSKNGDKLIDINNSGYSQRQRVEGLIKTFAEGRRENCNNVIWFREQVFLFQDETENMC